MAHPDPDQQSPLSKYDRFVATLDASGSRRDEANEPRPEGRAAADERKDGVEDDTEFYPQVR